MLNSHDGQAVTVVMIADWKAWRETVVNKDEDLGPGRGGRLSLAGVRRTHSRLTRLKLRLNDRFFLKSSLL